MQLQELMDAAWMKATESSEPPQNSAIIVFNRQSLLRYTKLIIEATCKAALELEGKRLDD